MLTRFLAGPARVFPFWRATCTAFEHKAQARENVCAVKSTKGEDEKALTGKNDKVRKVPLEFITNLSESTRGQWRSTFVGAWKDSGGRHRDMA